MTYLNSRSCSGSHWTASETSIDDITVDANDLIVVGVGNAVNPAESSSFRAKGGGGSFGASVDSVPLSINGVDSVTKKDATSVPSSKDDGDSVPEVEVGVDPINFCSCEGGEEAADDNIDVNEDSVAESGLEVEVI